MQARSLLQGRVERVPAHYMHATSMQVWHVYNVMHWS